MLRLLYGLTVDVDVHEEARIAPLPFAAHLHIMADKYDIGGLLHTAERSFQARAKTHWDTDEFVDAIRLVYTASPEHLRALRDCTLAVVLNHASEMLGKPFSTFCQSINTGIPDFGMELATAIMQRQYHANHTISSTPLRCNCNGCSCDFTIEHAVSELPYTCPLCQCSDIERWI